MSVQRKPASGQSARTNIFDRSVGNTTGSSGCAQPRLARGITRDVDAFPVAPSRQVRVMLPTDWSDCLCLLAALEGRADTAAAFAGYAQSSCLNVGTQRSR